MRILQILPALNSGGVERGTVDLAQALVKAGHQAFVASNGGRLVHRLDRIGATHYQLALHSKNPFIIALNTYRLKRLIKDEKIDLVHVRSRAPAWSAYYAAKQTNTPLVTTFHGTYNFKNYFKKAYNAVMTKGNRVIAVSNYIKTHILSHYAVDESKITVIARGIDLEQFHQNRVRPDHLQSLAQKWRLPDDRPIIMLPARITKWKGHLFLMDALEKLAEMLRSNDPTLEHPFHCVLVGDEQGAQPYVAEITAKIDRLKLQGMVQFVGHTDDIPTSLMLADVVVSTSLDPEAFGRTTVEAQAMGRPVIAPAHGGALEQIEDGVTGWLYRPHDVDGLANALRQAIALRQAGRAKLAFAARRNVEANFSLAQMTSSTIALYEDLIAR
ncbi:MAG: glycosyltransferase family 4 protein [Alphaproteobacteria bacterium]